MRAVVQCVSEASVTVEGRVVGAIGKGYAILLGVGHGDTEAEAERLCRKGNRPSFTDAAEPAIARRLYEHFAAMARADGFTVATGEFGAMMDVALVNHGPFTVVLDTDAL